MHRTGQAHFQETPLQRLAGAVQPDRERARRDAARPGHRGARLGGEIDPPDQIGIFAPQRRKQAVEAGAQGLVQLGIGPGRRPGERARSGGGLVVLAPREAALVTGNFTGEDLPKPAAQVADLAQVARMRGRAAGEALQNVLGLVRATEPAPQETRHLQPASEQRRAHRCVGREAIPRRAAARCFLGILAHHGHPPIRFDARYPAALRPVPRFDSRPGARKTPPA